MKSTSSKISTRVSSLCAASIASKHHNFALSSLLWFHTALVLFFARSHVDARRNITAHTCVPPHLTIDCRMLRSRIPPTNTSTAHNCKNRSSALPTLNPAMSTPLLPGQSSSPVCEYPQTSRIVLSTTPFFVSTPAAAFWLTLNRHDSAIKPFARSCASPAVTNGITIVSTTVSRSSY